MSGKSESDPGLGGDPDEELEKGCWLGSWQLETGLCYLPVCELSVEPGVPHLYRGYQACEGLRECGDAYTFCKLKSGTSARTLG